MDDCGSCVEAGNTNAVCLLWMFLYLVLLLLYSFSGLLVLNIHIDLWIRFTFGFRKFQNVKFEDTGRWSHVKIKWPIQKTVKLFSVPAIWLDYFIFLKSKRTIHKIWLVITIYLLTYCTCFYRRIQGGQKCHFLAIFFHFPKISPDTRCGL